MFEERLFGELFYKGYFSFRNDFIIVCKDLLDSCFLVFDIDRYNRDAIDDDFVHRYDKFYMFSKISDLAGVFLEFYNICYKG